MGLKTIILGDPETQGMKYRIRVFDHGHHIKTATVKNRGQNRIDLVVKRKDYGFLGEEVKLAFLINPDITPHYFGIIMEIDFDIRDTTQLGDLFDLCPDLVYEINQDYHERLSKLREKKSNVINAEFTEKKETEKEKTGKSELSDGVISLSDPVPGIIKDLEKIRSPFEKQLERIPGVKTTTRAAEAILDVPQRFRTNMRGINLLNEIYWAGDEDKRTLIKKTLDFCSEPGNQKCLKWLPKHLDIQPEILAIVSQTELDGVGIQPMYYIKQSTAEISEKMLQRPKAPDDWKTTALYLIAIIAIFGLVVALILKLSGRI